MLQPLKICNQFVITFLNFGKTEFLSNKIGKSWNPFILFWTQKCFLATNSLFVGIVNFLLKALLGLV
jgi:hypothetical protein